MPIVQELREDLTPREREELGWEKEAAKMQVELAERLKQHDVDIKRLEMKWTQVFRLPMAIILLPVKLVMAFAIPISVITKKELPKEYWEFIRG